MGRRRLTRSGVLRTRLVGLFGGQPPFRRRAERNANRRLRSGSLLAGATHLATETTIMPDARNSSASRRIGLFAPLLSTLLLVLAGHAEPKRWLALSAVLIVVGAIVAASGRRSAIAPRPNQDTGSPPSRRQDRRHGFEPQMGLGCLRGHVLERRKGQGALDHCLEPIANKVSFIDAFDREVIAHVAVTGAGISGSDVRDMMLAAVSAGSARIAPRIPSSICRTTARAAPLSRRATSPGSSASFPASRQSAHQRGAQHA